MTAIVFVGPTLIADEVHALVAADVRPPAAQGDIYRAVKDRQPTCIGLIDGYFDGVPSVWHKEILWTMAEGVQVFGSASMGALRAAELHSFGMLGVGSIYEAFRTGTLEDDDEVAVLHAPAELGFQPLSEPMVSIRATIGKAVARGVLARELAARLIGIAKAQHYSERTWDRLFEDARQQACSPADLQRLQDWLPDGRIDAKRDDAVAMLLQMAEAIATDEPARPVSYQFEWTDVWNELTKRVDADSTAADEDEHLVLDELRLDDEQFRLLCERAALRRLALAEARRRVTTPVRDDLIAEMSRHREANRLTRRADLGTWLRDNRLSERDYEVLLGEGHMIEAALDMPPEDLARHLIAELKWRGDYATLSERARQKTEALAGSGDASCEDELQRLKLVNWYFEQRLARPVPQDLDVYLRSIGLTGRKEFYRMVQREYDFAMLTRS